MKKKEKRYSAYYTQDKHDYVKSLVDQGESVTTSVTKMCEEFNIPFNENVNRNYRKRFQPKVIKSEEQSDELQTAKLKQYDSSKKRFIVTWGQTQTPIHEQFLTNLEAYANHIDASIHVIAGTYKNPTSLESSKAQKKKNKDTTNWHPRLRPYLDAKRQKIHEYLCILSDVKVPPTASTPLSGFNGITALESCIIGHPRVHFKSLPVMDGYPNKLLLTTGAITLENYTDSKAGAKGSFHHTLGAVIIELDGDIFHVRQIQCDSEGTFCDLLFELRDGKVGTYLDKSGCPAIIFGDLHTGQHCQVSLDVALTLARDMMCERVILHDIFDGKSISHHEANNPFVLLESEKNDLLDLEAEIERMVGFIKDNDDLNYVVVRSNHDDFLDRWLINTDWRKQANKSAYLYYAMVLSSGKAPKGVIPYVLESRCKNVIGLGINDSYRVMNWELSIHGHLGSNGSRGSAIQFKQLNTKNITGHTHTPTREDGHLSVGTLTKLRIGYNNGASAWLNTCVVIYPTGKASHINIIKGKYTNLY